MSTLPLKVLKNALDECEITIEDLRNILSNNKKAQDALNVLGQWNISSDASQNFLDTDFRFCHLLLKNFRKFGNLNDKFYYGLKFVRQADANSKQIIDFLTLLGDNGIGKSSLVDSLEYMFTGHIGEAKIRQISEKFYIRNKSGDGLVKICLNNGLTFVLDDENCKRFRQEYDVSNFFFSENSILKFAEYTHRNGEDANDWFPFFCHVLGLGSLFDACAQGGLLDVIRGEVLKIINAIGSESVSQVRKNLEARLRDGIIQTDIKQQTYLVNLRSKLNVVRQDIFEGKIHDKGELQKLFVKRDFLYLNKFYFIKDLHNLYKNLEQPTSDTSISQETTGKKILSWAKNTELDYVKRLAAQIDDCIMHINNVLKYGAGFVAIDDIKADVVKLINKERSSIVVDRYQTSDELKVLLAKIDWLKKSIFKQIHQIVFDYVDQDLVDAVKTIFDNTFITEDEQDLNFDICELADKKRISISIKEEPIHKYFNTFRYRLFCLTLQAVLNIKLMEKEKFLFPFILDDVFYANDYKNKRELYKYFEQIRIYADGKLKDNQKLQIIFFTHDEQIVSCFADKFKDDSFVRLLSPEFATQLEGNVINVPNPNEKYHNLYFELYGEYVSKGKK